MHIDQTYPATIRAAVSENAISKVSRFFDATAGQIVGELLQNARRSGATEVRVATVDGEVTIADNGCGIDDPSAILSFGYSGWEQGTMVAEDPAGMGSFSLARRHASITSRPATGDPDKIAPAWGVELQPDHFVGTKAAQIVSGADAPRPHGTQTSFRIDKTARELEWAIEQAAEHYPLPVMLNGRPVIQKSMLDGCIHTERWNGMRIGVRRNPDNHWNRGIINFHGHKVNCETLPRVTATRMSSEQPMSWWIVIDVVEGNGLELVLPARHQVVHNDYLDQLINAAWNTLYRGLAMEQPANLPYVAWSDAKRRGFALESAGPQLAHWKPERADACEQPEARYYGEERAQVHAAGGEALLMTAKLEYPDGHVLARALEAAGLSRNTRIDDTNRRLQRVETRVDEIGRDIGELRDWTGKLEGTLSTFIQNQGKVAAA